MGGVGEHNKNLHPCVETLSEAVHACGEQASRVERLLAHQAAGIRLLGPLASLSEASALVWPSGAPTSADVGGQEEHPGSNAFLGGARGGWGGGGVRGPGCSVPAFLRPAA